MGLVCLILASAVAVPAGAARLPARVGQATAVATTQAPVFLAPVLAPSLAHIGQNVRVPVIIMLRSQTSRVHLLSMAATSAQAVLRKDASHVVVLPIINGMAATVSGHTLALLAANPAIGSIVTDGRYHLLPTPDLSGLQNALAQQVSSIVPPQALGGTVVQAAPSVEPEALSIVHADTVQAQGITGAGVRVAIIDSGFDINQPNMQGVLATDAHGHPLRVDFTGTDLTDTIGHGTACASMIVGQGTVTYKTINTHLSYVWPEPVNQQGARAQSTFSIRGMAPGVRIMSAKIFDTRVPNQGGYDSWIIRAIQWAVQNHADIISESFGGLSLPSNGTDPIALADEAAVKAGVIVVAANGNDGPGNTTVGSPASAPDVVAVGASTMYRHFAQIGFLASYNQATNDQMASFSSRGPTWDGRVRPDIVAPGSFGWANFPTNPSTDGPTAAPFTYGTFGGTSQATPIAAGVLALMVQAFHQAHPHQAVVPATLKSVLMSSADDLGYPGQDQGAGRVNVLRAVDMILHQGASFSVAPNSLVLPTTLPGASQTGTFTVTNTGNRLEHLRVDVQADHVQTALTFNGSTLFNHDSAFPIQVPAGVAKISVYINWTSSSQITLGDGSVKPVELRIALYDPNKKFVNYAYGVGNGYAVTTAAHPISGRWVAVVTESGRADSTNHVFFLNERYTAHVTLDSYISAGTITPTQADVPPGGTQAFTLLVAAPGTPTSDVFTVHVRGSHVATIPVARTAAIPFIDNQGIFQGQFTGPGNVGLGSEFRIYNFPVQPGTSSLSLSLTWPNSGYGILALLMDPNGNIVDAQYNGVTNPLNPAAPPDLSAHKEQMFWSAPVSGNWQIAVNDLTFTGLQAAESFQGQVTLNQGMVSPVQIVQTVQAGKSTVLNLSVHNNGVSSEQVFGYATTDQYAYIPVQAVAGPLGQGSAVISNTQVFTFNTGFVPPATRMLVSYAAAISPSIPIDLHLSDPIGGSRGSTTPGPVSFGGHTYVGSTAVVENAELMMGAWSGLITLAQSSNERTTTTIMGSTLAYALQPNPWVAFTTLLSNGQLQGQSLSLKPLQSGMLPLRISIPPNTAAGTYTGHLFVYSLNGDEMANLPLTINVLASPPAPNPTAQPEVDKVVSSVYFPGGTTSGGATESLDLLNTSNTMAHSQVVLSQDGGQSAVTNVAVPAHSHIDVNVNQIVGANQTIAATVASDQNLAVGRAILRPNQTGTYSVGDLNPSTVWYFADGYTVDTFDERVVLYNPHQFATQATITMYPDNHTLNRSYSLTISPLSHQTVDLNVLVPAQALSAIVTANHPIVAERLQTFGAKAAGMTSRLGTTVPATDLYFDAGNRVPHQQTHLALFNPGHRAAHVELTYTDVSGVVLGFQVFDLAPLQRTTPNLTTLLKADQVGVYVHSSQPVVGERVSYFGDIAHLHLGATDSFGAARAAVTWTFPGGTTGAGFTEDIALANPFGSHTSTVRATFYTNTGKVWRYSFSVRPQQRLVIAVNKLPGLPAGTHGSQLVSVNGQPFYAAQSLVYLHGTAGLDSTGLAS